MAGELENSILIDTSVIVEHFRKTRKSETRLYQLAASGMRLAISSVTAFELLCGTTDAPKLAYVNRLLDELHVIPVDLPVAQKAAEVFLQLKQANQLISPADLLIGATALHHDLSLATLNRRHFERIPGIALAAGEP